MPEKQMDHSKLCFVIGPIGKLGSEPRIHADWLLNGIIKPVMASFPEFRVKRADEDPRPGMIDAQLINDLLTADLVIADLSFLNPNAFYEIGIRHMVWEKPIIHMQRETEEIPFDLSLYRAVKFSRVQYHELEAAKTDLKKAVEAVLADDYQPENPVTNARGRIRVREHATPELRVLSDQMEALQKRLVALELTNRLFQTSSQSGEPPNLDYLVGEWESDKRLKQADKRLREMEDKLRARALNRQRADKE
jgi:hypothetical protein